ncbi:hypothetical protein [Alistipes finegoldii]|uniref:hypothetical protein n=1 Tax=Alistipes finegoldii TaxID=214856 RepID=UPI001DE44189|nr:hypothetical protein [Alistipes finegoldii]MDY4090226.1 hypothetical protein [Alistipes finegoldii]HJG72711.1 hypothetical protein [Alistipes finegoldii]
MKLTENGAVSPAVSEIFGAGPDFSPLSSSPQPTHNDTQNTDVSNIVTGSKKFFIGLKMGIVPEPFRRN